MKGPNMDSASKAIKFRVKSRAQSYARRTTIHGLQDACLAPNRKIRTIWVLIITGVVMLLTYQIWKVVSEYKTEPTATIVKIEDIKQFPQVVYCPQTWSKESHVRNKGLNLKEFLYIISMLLDPFDIPKNMSISPDEQQDVDRLVMMYNGSLDAVLKYLAFDIDEAVGELFLSWKKQQLPTSRKIIRSTGVCYLIDATNVALYISGEKPYLSAHFSRLDALFSTKDVNPDLKYFVFGHDGLSQFAGNRLWFTSKADRKVNIRASKFTHLPTKRRPCEYYTEVERSKCMYQCKLSHVRDVNCTMFFPGKVTKTKFCSSFTDPIESFKSEVVDKQCAKKCKDPCVKWVYSSTVVTETNSYLTKLAGHQNGSTLIFKIENGKNTMAVKETRIYSVTSLLANIGGTISLLCGASLLSVVQICYYICYSKSREQRLQKQSTDVNAV